MGHYTRGNAELCLIATKGRVGVIDRTVSQILIHPKGRHSEKPACVRDRIIQLVGDLPRVELFARDRTPGWDVWGNEVDSDITL